MNAEIERIVAAYRRATGRRLGDLEEVCRPRQLPAQPPRSREVEPEPESEDPYYRPKSWLI